jgi:hypothetical protein
MKKILSLVLASILAVTPFLVPPSAPVTVSATDAYGKLSMFPRMPAAGPNPHYAIQPLLPNNRSRAEMNADIIGRFNNLEHTFLVEQGHATTNNPDTFRMILKHNYSTTGTDGQVTCSESMGYGMLILAYLAGAPGDGGAVSGGLNLRTIGGRRLTVQDYFDAMHRTHAAFPTNGGSSFAGNGLAARRWLIAWQILGNGTGINTSSWNINYTGPSSAADGDLDMAYAYILAHQLWGSNGTVNYLAWGMNMIEAIWRDVTDGNNRHLRLGNWASNATSTQITRPSDFMLYQLRVFNGTIVNDVGADVKLSTRDWQLVIDATQDAIGQGTDPALRAGVPSSSANATPNTTTRTGFLPGFMYRDNTGSDFASATSTTHWGVSPVLSPATTNSFAGKWIPSDGRRFKEANNPVNDRLIDSNACRVPWRLATDVLLYGDASIRYRTGANTWNTSHTIRSASLDPWFARSWTGASITAPYLRYMDGSGEGTASWIDYTAPIALAASVCGTQAQVNTAWQVMRTNDVGNNEFGAYYNIICMVTASGNAWDPLKVKIGASASPAVVVGAQENTVITGVGGAVTFPVSTMLIPTEESYTPAVANLPAGVTANSAVMIADDGTGTLALTVGTSAETGVYPNLTLTVNGVTSPPFTLRITHPDADKTAVGFVYIFTEPTSPAWTNGFNNKTSPQEEFDITVDQDVRLELPPWPGGNGTLTNRREIYLIQPKGTPADRIRIESIIINGVHAFGPLTSQLTFPTSSGNEWLYASKIGTVNPVDIPAPDGPRTAAGMNDLFGENGLEMKIFQIPAGAFTIPAGAVVEVVYRVGSGGASEISALPSELNFGVRTEGYTDRPAAQTVTVTNTGKAMITLDALPTVTGWTLTAAANWTAPMASGQSRTFTIRPDLGLSAASYIPPVGITGSGGSAALVTASFKVYSIGIKYGVLTAGGTMPASNDVTLLRRYIAAENKEAFLGSANRTALNIHDDFLYAADVNGDGIISAADVALLRLYIARGRPGPETMRLGPQ